MFAIQLGLAFGIWMAIVGFIWRTLKRKPGPLFAIDVAGMYAAGLLFAGFFALVGGFLAIKLLHAIAPGQMSWLGFILLAASGGIFVASQTIAVRVLVEVLVPPVTPKPTQTSESQPTDAKS